MTPDLKRQAIMKLKDCLYREQENVQYTYGICQVNDGGQALESHKKMIK